MPKEKRIQELINIHKAKCVESLEAIIQRPLDSIELQFVKFAFSCGLESSHKIEEFFEQEMESETTS